MNTGQAAPPHQNIQKVYIWGVMLCGLIIVFMCIEHLKNYKFYVIAGATILYICVISHSVGGVLERYYWPAISIILVGIPYLTGIICERLQQNYNTVIRKKICTYCSMMILLVFILRDIYSYREPENISYLKSRSENQIERLKEVSDVPWVIFAEDIGSLYHGLYDFTIASEIYIVPEDGLCQGDEKIKNVDKLVVCTIEDYKEIDECIRCLNGGANHKYTKKTKIALSGVYSVYIVT